jgi:hypothetical protein
MKFPPRQKPAAFNLDEVLSKSSGSDDQREPLVPRATPQSAASRPPRIRVVRITALELHLSRLSDADILGIKACEAPNLVTTSVRDEFSTIVI